MRPVTPTAVVAMLSLGLLLAGCSASGEAATTPSATPTAAATPSAEPTPSPTPAAVGSQEKPATPGVDTVTLVDADAPVYEVALGAANFDAGDAITAVYTMTDPAPEGTSYVLLPVTATYVGSGPLEAQAWLDLKITFVAADGRTVDAAPVVVPDDLSVTPKLATGESATGNLVFTVPQDALTGGLWSVEYTMGTTGEVVWFTAA